jgi:hypothetical protein
MINKTAPMYVIVLTDTFDAMNWPPTTAIPVQIEWATSAPIETNLQSFDPASAIAMRELKWPYLLFVIYRPIQRGK